ncbi:MAG: succinylglutamate desuccinylase/aspartoacylase family protein [bacterium]
MSPTRTSKPREDEPGDSAQQESGRAPRPRPIRIIDFEPGKRTDLLVKIFESATGQPVHLPVVVARGAGDGPVVGVTATVHGNELNGIRIIHGLLEDLDLAHLRGSLLCAPIVNVPAFNLRQREFTDGRDLNHFFPGKERGVPAEQYARAITRTLLPACHYLIDIHTASWGRINTMYLRADLRNPVVRRLALVMNPEIILHTRGGDGTLRHAARQRGIHALTVEAGNPNTFQGRMVFEGEVGILNVLVELGLRDGVLRLDREPVICRRSAWLRTTTGGLLKTSFHLRDRVVRRQLLAQTLDPFGNVMREYHAPRAGIVIGMAVNPLAVPGTQYCHLGEIGEPDPPAPQEGSDAQEPTS